MTLMMRERDIEKRAKKTERRKIISKMVLQGFDDEQIMMLCDTSEEEIEICREDANFVLHQE